MYIPNDGRTVSPVEWRNTAHALDQAGHPPEPTIAFAQDLARALDRDQIAAHHVPEVEALLHAAEAMIIDDLMEL